MPAPGLSCHRKTQKVGGMPCIYFKLLSEGSVDKAKDGRVSKKKSETGKLSKHSTAMLEQASEETIKNTTRRKSNKISKKTGKLQVKPLESRVDKKRLKRIEQRRLRRAKKKVAYIMNTFHSATNRSASGVARQDTGTKTVPIKRNILIMGTPFASSVAPPNTLPSPAKPA